MANEDGSLWIVFNGHGLLAGRQIDDGQAGHAKPHVTLHGGPSVVRPTVG